MHVNEFLWFCPNTPHDLAQNPSVEVLPTRFAETQYFFKSCYSSRLVNIMHSLRWIVRVDWNTICCGNKRRYGRHRYILVVIQDPFYKVEPERKLLLCPTCCSIWKRTQGNWWPFEPWSSCIINSVLFHLLLFVGLDDQSDDDPSPLIRMVFTVPPLCRMSVVMWCNVFPQNMSTGFSLFIHCVSKKSW